MQDSIIFHLLKFNHKQKIRSIFILSFLLLSLSPVSVFATEISESTSQPVIENQVQEPAPGSPPPVPGAETSVQTIEPSETIQADQQAVIDKLQEIHDLVDGQKQNDVQHKAVSIESRDILKEIKDLLQVQNESIEKQNKLVEKQNEMIQEQSSDVSKIRILSMLCAGSVLGILITYFVYRIFARFLV